MAAAIPAVLLPVVLQGAAQMGAAFGGGNQEIRSCLGAVEKELWFQDASGRAENFCVLILLPMEQIGQQHGTDHETGHAPFVEPGGHIEVRGVPGVLPDIGDAVQAHGIQCQQIGPVLIKLKKVASMLVQKREMGGDHDLLRPDAAMLCLRRGADQLRDL